MLFAAACSQIIDADRYSVGSDSEPMGMGGTDGNSRDPNLPGDGQPSGMGGGVPGGEGGSATALDPLGSSGAGGTSPLTPAEEMPPAVLPTCDNLPVDFDDLFQQIAEDAARLDAADVSFSRYISLTNRVTAGQCREALERDRQGLFKMLNMLSSSATIAQPTSINTDQTLFRINLRDYDWDRAISVDGVNFVDVWEAIADKNSYSVPFVGDDADDVVGDTQTRIPLMFADQMLDVAVVGNLYYAIIGVDVNQTVSDFFLNDLDVDIVANLADETSVRAGTTRSTVSLRDRLIQRDDIDAYRGALWQVFDFADGGNGSIFEDPFGFIPDSTLAIFSLQNGLFGFLIADRNELVVEQSDLLLDVNQNNFRMTSAVSCLRCHAAGIIPVVDEVLGFVLANSVALGLNRDEVEQLQSIYVDPAQLATIVEADSTEYRQALQRAGLPTTGTDPVADMFDRFDQDMRLADAAGDFGVSPADLQDRLPRLHPALGTLGRDGVLDRDDFEQFFVDGLCILSEDSVNRPDDAACAEAAANAAASGN